MSGTVFPETVALFFRPISSLSYALNYAVWGMDPLAFHLTDVLIHLAATLALYALASMLGLRPWAAAISAATFALHPIMASVVPNLPRRHDSLAAAGVFAALALAAWVVKQPRWSPGASTRHRAGRACARVRGARQGDRLSGASARRAHRVCRGDLGRAEHLRDCLRTYRHLLFAFGLTTALLIAWRWLVFGGLGGTTTARRRFRTSTSRSTICSTTSSFRSIRCSCARPGPG